MRTQADRDDDLAIGRELERKDAEIERLTLENWQLRGALGYPVPGDVPQGDFKCGLCEARAVNSAGNPSCWGDEMSEWQPIETVPKDGTPVILWSKLAKDSIMGRCIGGNWQAFPEPSCGLIPNEFSHWMPRPGPPAT